MFFFNKNIAEKSEYQMISIHSKFRAGKPSRYRDLGFRAWVLESEV
ncbi:MAG: Uncharacterised protein [SAR116 cluster bacterium]|nr:MAG: Uncharacterised protein [SAR116 cluster bacterium]